MSKRIYMIQTDNKINQKKKEFYHELLFANIGNNKWKNYVHFYTSARMHFSII